jgi:hypothetical protein
MQSGQAQMALLLLIGEFNVRTSKQHEGGMRGKAVVNLVTLSKEVVEVTFEVRKEQNTQ